jgi:hypothetical protein
LFKNGAVVVNANSGKLEGDYASAIAGMSATSISLSGIYIVYYIFGLFKYRHHSHITIQKIYWTVLLIAILLGIAMSGINLHMTENYQSLHISKNIESSPIVPISGENYKLRGSYGTATMGVASAAVAFASLGAIQMLIAAGMTKDMAMSDHTSPSIKSRKLSTKYKFEHVTV